MDNKLCHIFTHVDTTLDPLYCHSHRKSHSCSTSLFFVFWMAWCMVAHSSDMQDPSWHMILRHLQTAHHHHLLTNTPLFLDALHQTHYHHIHNADGLVTAYMHLPGITSSIHCNALPQTQHYHALRMPTHSLLQRRDCCLMMLASKSHINPCSLIIGHQSPRFGYIGRLLYLQSSTPTTLIQHWDCAWLDYCTAFSYSTTPLQYQPFSHVSSTVSRWTGLLPFLEALSQAVGWISL
jgi:hypothetical protein